MKILMFLTLLITPSISYSLENVGRYIEGNFKDKNDFYRSEEKKNIQYLLSCGEALGRNSQDGFIGSASDPGVKFINSPDKDGIYIFHGKDTYFLSRKDLKKNANYGLSMYFGNKKISFELITGTDTFTFADTKYYRKNPVYRNLSAPQVAYPHQPQKINPNKDVFISAQTAIKRSIEKRIARIKNEQATGKKPGSDVNISEMGPIDYCLGVAEDLKLDTLKSFVQTKLKKEFKFYSNRFPASTSTNGGGSRSTGSSSQNK
tara:strand:+ start:16518 stop:17300 length:783 start_codon:yes stop_codon:yes gene_type:complete